MQGFEFIEEHIRKLSQSGLISEEVIKERYKIFLHELYGLLAKEIGLIRNAVSLDCFKAYEKEIKKFAKKHRLK